MLDITTPEIRVNIIRSSNVVSGLRIDDYVRVTCNNAVDGSCSIGNNFSVVANSTFNGTVSIRTPQRNGGNLQSLTPADGNESSIGYYNRVDERATTAGDMWISGVNCCSRTGYTIGTPVLNGCFNISNTGATTVDYRLITPLLYATTIRASNATVITLQDDVAITSNLNVGGVISKYQTAGITTSVATDIMVRLLNGIVINTNTTPSSLTLPTGTTVYNSHLIIDKSIAWSVINTGTSTGTLTINEVAGHTVVGSKGLAIGTSGLFRTRVSAANTAITYRIS